MILTMEQLASCTGARIDRAQAFLPHLVATMRAYEINTPGRAASFLAQVGHESAGLRYTTELWSPDQVPAQARYEGRADLGNTKPGDGFKYRGHGLLQITGRANHASARDRLRVRFGIRVPDFEEKPDALAEFEWAALSAGDFWARRGLNELADTGDFEKITRRINGGTNGLKQRAALWETGKAVLS